MASFKNIIYTFTSDHSGDDYQRFNWKLFNPLLGVSLSSRDIMKLRFEDLAVARSWKLVMFKPWISNSWKLCG
jgi:hypothetical protein